MVVLNNFYFIKDASTAMVSEETHNSSGDNLMIQVEGTATSFVIKILGCADNKSEDFYQLTTITPNFDLVDDIDTKGLYSVGMDGIAKIKVQLYSIADGEINVFGKMTKGV